MLVNELLSVTEVKREPPLNASAGSSLPLITSTVTKAFLEIDVATIAGIFAVLMGQEVKAFVPTVVSTLPSAKVNAPPAKQDEKAEPQKNDRPTRKS